MSIELMRGPDTFELVRDQIAMLLSTAVASQQRMAAIVGENPDDWRLRIYTERSNAWEQFLADDPADKSPIVNVWYDTSTFDAAASNIVERQKAEAVYNIDCIGYAMAEEDPAGGHVPGDMSAAFAAHRALRYVRRILMAGENTYLNLRGTVWRRWPESVKMFQPAQGERAIQQIVGGRLALRVAFNEMSPQVVAQALDIITATVSRAQDGEVIALANYENTGE